MLALGEKRQGDISPLVKPTDGQLAKVYPVAEAKGCKAFSLIDACLSSVPQASGRQSEEANGELVNLKQFGVVFGLPSSQSAD